MHLIVQTYSLIELQQVRSELEKRGIRVHVSDEFTYAIPGMPGAEQPRGIWVALPEDILPAQQVVTDLVGADRLEPVQADHGDVPASKETSFTSSSAKQVSSSSHSPWPWILFVMALAFIWLLNS